MRVSGLAQNAPTPFSMQPDSQKMAGLAQELELSGLRKLRFEGQIAAHGATDWLLTGMLGATVTQPCAVTLVPVTTRIDTEVRRLYIRDYEEIDAPEAEMPEDDEVEPLGVWIDPEAVMVEALSLAVPDFPRADGAELGQMVLTEPGVAPLTDEAAKPFAGLSDLKAKLERDEDG
ncbi:50S ribosomal protein L34 [Tateyamaria sp. ANG-S1]|nr:50S ribosomal protein L34 [Tateyamaria sp. ANG-S1]